jgi:hypothetical protein
MQQRNTLLMSSLFLFLTAWFLTSCGSSNSKSDPATAGPLAGNWQMSLQPSESTLNPRSQAGFLQQNGNAVTGSLLLTDVPCSGIGNVTGTISGADVALVISPTGLMVNLNGTLASSSNSMSGDYTILSTGCSAANTAPQTGTWTANLVPPFSGNFTGTFVDGSGITYPVSGQLTQGSNSGSSTAPITGTLSITGYCFSSANITGLVGGTSVVLNLVDPSGNQIGEMFATSSLDASSMSGTYKYVGQGTTGVQGCVAGHGGTFTLNL